MKPVFLLLLALFATPVVAQDFTHADTLRGSNGPGRAWWDVTFYDLNVAVSPEDSSISGHTDITYRVLAAGDQFQVDLQPPMVLTSVVLAGKELSVRQEENAWFVSVPHGQRVGQMYTVTANFQGRPRIAVRPPWDGGYQWTESSDGTPWVVTSNQGLGASIWWPNKDQQSEEPDSQRIAITVPNPLKAVSNGRLRSTEHHNDGTTTYEWFVTNPINNYSVSMNAGAYQHWSESFDGENGPLDMDFWPLLENLDKAKAQWTQARSTMACFEHWFGPYPFYEDGYKLIEVPYLGMEHQSGVTYGNQYENGYLGTDLSGTGWGLEWDFIVVHESAHEWWGNNITARDIADNWVHESFANYAENLYTECLTGSKEAGSEYVIGTRSRITNTRPIVGPYGVNSSGDGDMYYKGGNLLHLIRQLVDDDAAWRSILRGLNHDLRHQVVSGARVEEYITQESGISLAPVFEQYLRTANVPVFEWQSDGETVSYRWNNVNHGFKMPVRVTMNGNDWIWLTPTESWQAIIAGETMQVDPNFYVLSSQVQ